jgi:geranylgeranyl pyrophosphate synthase
LEEPMMACQLTDAGESEAIDLLTEYFSESWLDALCGPAHAISRDRWEQALLGPARQVLSAPGRKFRGRLVELAWKLSGATGSPAPTLALLVEGIHAGSLVVDDVQDGSRMRRGKPALHRLCGVPLAINTGNWLYFWSHELVSHLELKQAQELEIRRRVSRAQLLGHYGQALDLSLRASALPQEELMPLAQSIARLKTGSLTELAARLGAVAADARPDMAESLAAFGREVGVALQHLDDLGGILSSRRRDKGQEDLEQDRVTFVWGYAAQRLPAGAFARLQEARRALDGHRCRGAVDGPSEGPPMDAVSSALRETVSDGARSMVHDRLGAALRALQERFGPSSVMQEISREIERLEQGYD